MIDQPGSSITKVAMEQIRCQQTYQGTVQTRVCYSSRFLKNIFSSMTSFFVCFCCFVSHKKDERGINCDKLNMTRNLAIIPLIATFTPITTGFEKSLTERGRGRIWEEPYRGRRSGKSLREGEER